MYDVDSACSQLDSFCNLEWQIDELVRRIDQVLINLTNAENEINCFQINGIRLDDRKITSIREELSGYKHYLLNTCKNSAFQCKESKIAEIESNGYTIIWG